MTRGREARSGHDEVVEQSRGSALDRPMEDHASVHARATRIMQRESSLTDEQFVQRLESYGVPAPQGDRAVQETAAAGVAGSGGQLPHLDTIQAAFGPHDVSHVRAHVGGPAADAATAIGAQAYATGNDVAFASQPDLHTAAHEAAHVVQQRQGVHLKGGVGQAGDVYEQQADKAADAVVAGRDAAHVLGTPAAYGGVAVQRKETDEGAAESPAAELRRALADLMRQTKRADNATIAKTVGGVPADAVAGSETQSVADATIVVAALLSDPAVTIDRATKDLVAEAYDRVSVVSTGASGQTAQVLRFAEQQLLAAATRAGIELEMHEARSEPAGATSTDHSAMVSTCTRLIVAEMASADGQFGAKGEELIIVRHVHVIAALLRELRRHIGGAAKGSQAVTFVPEVDSLEPALKTLWSWGRAAKLDMRDTGLEAVFDLVDAVRHDVNLDPLGLAERYYASQTPEAGGKDGATMVDDILAIWSAHAKTDELAIQQFETLLMEPVLPKEPRLFDGLMDAFVRAIVGAIAGRLASSIGSVLARDLGSGSQSGGPIFDFSASQLTAAMQNAATGTYDGPEPAEAEGAGDAKDGEPAPHATSLRARFLDKVRSGVVANFIAAQASLSDQRAALIRLPPDVLANILRDLKSISPKQLWAEAKSDVVMHWMNFCAAAHHGVQQQGSQRLDLDPGGRPGETVGDHMRRVGGDDYTVHVQAVIRTPKAGGVTVAIESARVAGATPALLAELHNLAQPLGTAPVNRRVHLSHGAASQGEIYVAPDNHVDISRASRPFLASLVSDDANDVPASYEEALERGNKGDAGAAYIGAARILQEIRETTKDLT